MDGREWGEELIAEQAVVGREVADHGRLDVEPAVHSPIREPLPADEHASVPARLADGLLMPVDRSLVDDRTQPVLAEERVADRDRLGLLHEEPDQLVVDGLLDVDPAVRRALLATETEGAPQDPLGRLLDLAHALYDRLAVPARHEAAINRLVPADQPGDALPDRDPP